MIHYRIGSDIQTFTVKFEGKSIDFANFLKSSLISHRNNSIVELTTLSQWKKAWLLGHPVLYTDLNGTNPHVHWLDPP